MLPDFPKAKKKLTEMLLMRFRNRSKQHMGPFGQARVKAIHEGKGAWILKREDGSIDDRGRLKETGVDMTFEKDEMEKLSFEDVLKKFDQAADEMGKKISGDMYQSLNDILEETGNKIDGRGEPFSVDKFFEVFDKIFINFDENGEPQLPSIVAGPELVARIQSVLAEIYTDAKNKERYDQIIERKRQEWRDRENSRKLVG